MISVIIPVYNCEKYIKKCVDSVLNGTYQDFEILLINDESTDNSLEVIKELEKKDFRIKVYDESHSGVSGIRNKGIRYASGEYIAFIDGDDYVEKEYLEELIKPMINDEVDWVACGYKRVREERNTVTEEKHFPDSFIRKDDLSEIIERVFKSDNFHNLYSNCMGLYRKRIIEDNDLFNDESLLYGEDVYFNYNYAHYIKSFAYIAKPLYNYIVHNKSSSHSFIKKIDYAEMIKLIQNIEDKRAFYKEKQTVGMSIYYINLFIRPLVDNLFINDLSENRIHIEELKDCLDNKTVKEVLNNVKVLDVIKNAKNVGEGVYYAIYYFILRYKLFDLGYKAWNFKHKLIKKDIKDNV